ncbi:nucleotidyltransferase family protein [Arcticibacter sp.]|uniref:nucleotidyltransferase family protein n=1 Tax=Arcticibacter sp. TaxID=1872630 RepID=UPI00389077CC
MTKEAIILAGGLGTRLQSVVKDVPKPMAEVAGRPFLDYIMYFLAKNNITKAVLAVGHKYEIIQEHLDKEENRYGMEISYSIEKELLGTGGAICQAFSQITGDKAFIINGDTYFDMSLSDLDRFADAHHADLAFALKETTDSQRYGNVVCSSDSKILSFTEKGETAETTIRINGGIYLMQKSLLARYPMPERFSIEQDFFQSKTPDLNAYGKTYPGTFIDIGIPQDFLKAQKLLQSILPS